jgi:hypothetical protein
MPWHSMAISKRSRMITRWTSSPAQMASKFRSSKLTSSVVEFRLSFNNPATTMIIPVRGFEPVRPSLLTSMFDIDGHL